LPAICKSFSFFLFFFFLSKIRPGEC
jgi:hypothetical protein